ncbi:hypothetical protein J3R30DRAFT_3402541 [Lentinula aciculospora]|uniref:Uncharacterized protein n=1 Tax=Lentinula aciculospora TaxID=153920 RepID=A0A9W9AM94_9AGAR|nr:hypothetical protein J3R30DRAFT_3402541 [Lentinula aciculospora]
MRLLPSTSFHRLCPVFAVLLVIALLSVTIVASPLAAANGKLAHRETYGVYVALFDTTKQAYVENPTSPGIEDKNQQVLVFMRNKVKTVGYKFVQSASAIQAADPPNPFDGSSMLIGMYTLDSPGEPDLLFSRGFLETWVQSTKGRKDSKIKNDIDFVNAYLSFVKLSLNDDWTTLKNNLFRFSLIINSHLVYVYIYPICLYLSYISMKKGAH